MFRAWGRIGTTIGGTKLDSMNSLQEAIKLFKHKYADETGNQWEQRHNFKKMPHKMVPMDLDLGVVSLFPSLLLFIPLVHCFLIEIRTVSGL